MNISIFSSNNDIGHFFIQQGIKKLINGIYNGIDINFQIIDKHGVNKIELIKTILDSTDILILGGGPLIWPYFELSDWSKEIYSLLIKYSKSRKTMIALSIGSCYDVNSSYKYSSPRKEEIYHLLKLIENCKLITTRDEYINNILVENKIPSLQLPCIAFNAFYDESKYQDINTKADKMLINYMYAAGHHDYSFKVNPQQWNKCIISVLNHFTQKYDVEFICHSTQELELAKVVDDKIKANLISNFQDFIECNKGVILSMNNRIHASIGQAGLLIPSITVGTDTRIYSLKEFEMPYVKINEATSDYLINEMNNQISNREENVIKLNKKLNQTIDLYANNIRKII